MRRDGDKLEGALGGQPITRILLVIGVLPLVIMVIASGRSAALDIRDYQVAQAAAKSADGAIALAEIEQAIQAESLLANDVAYAATAGLRNESETIFRRIQEVFGTDNDVRFAERALATDRSIQRREDNVGDAWFGDTGMGSPTLAQELEDVRLRVDELPAFREAILAGEIRSTQTSLTYGRLTDGVALGFAAEVDALRASSDNELGSLVASLEEASHVTSALRAFSVITSAGIGDTISERASSSADLVERAEDLDRSFDQLEDSMSPAEAQSWRTASVDLRRTLKEIADPGGEVLTSGPVLSEEILGRLFEAREVSQRTDFELRTYIERTSNAISEISSDGQASARTSLAISMTLTMITVGLIAAGVRGFARSTVEPLRRAAFAAHQVSEGDLSSAELEPHGPQEVRAMSAALSNVIDAVQLIERQASAMADGETSAPVLDEQLPGELGDTLGRSIGRWREVSERSNSLNALNDAIAEATLDAQLLCDQDLIVVQANPTAERLFEHDSGDMIGVNIEDVLAASNRSSVAASLRDRPALVLDRAVVKTPSRSEVPVTVTITRVDTDAGRVHSVIIRDLSERVTLLEQLAHEASHDSLTNLRSRPVLVAAIDEAGPDADLGIVFLDVDHFKDVNDRFGQLTADDVLRTVAVRVETAAPAGSIVARMGGDEIAVLVYDAPDTEKVRRVADRLLASIRVPALVGGDVITVTASAGVAQRHGERHGEDGPDLMVGSALALREAKRLGGDRVVAHDDAFVAELEQRNQIERELVGAIEEDQLVLHFQPVWDIGANSMVGVEAMVRWPLPDGTLRSPAEFIPIAEESDLIVELDKWVIETSASQLAQWAGSELDGLHIAVNISARHLNGDLARVLRETCERHRVDPRRLAIEVTESYLADDLDHSRAVLDQLHKLGAALLIDDFGTGYSSLAYLQELPFDVLKIDRAFVSKMGNKRSDSIVDALIGLAKTMDLTVLAEGVETQAQYDALAELGCDQIQGFLLARPEPAERLTDFCGVPANPRDTASNVRRLVRHGR